MRVSMIKMGRIRKTRFLRNKRAVDIGKGVDIFVSILLLVVIVIIVISVFSLSGVGEKKKIQEQENYRRRTTALNNFLRTPLSAFDRTALSEEVRDGYDDMFRYIEDPVVADVFTFRKIELKKYHKLLAALILFDEQMKGYVILFRDPIPEYIAPQLTERVTLANLLVVTNPAVRTLAGAGFLINTLSYSGIGYAKCKEYAYQEISLPRLYSEDLKQLNIVLQYCSEEEEG